MEEYILAFDEINAMTAVSFQSVKEENKSADEVADDILSFLVSAFMLGIHTVESSLHYVLPVNVDEMYDVIFLIIEGKTFEDRVHDHVNNGDLKGLQTLAESEYHRVYNTAVEKGAEMFSKSTGEAVSKTWITVKDDRVRETHSYLEGQAIGLHDEFYTFDGDHALYPGGFTKAENNVNCRCVIKVNRER